MIWIYVFRYVFFLSLSKAWTQRNDQIKQVFANASPEFLKGEAVQTYIGWPFPGLGVLLNHMRDLKFLNGDTL